MSAEPNIREIVANEITSKLCGAFGYRFGTERERRIARHMDILVHAGWGGAAAFAEAVEEEILLHGEVICDKRHK